MTGNTKTQNYHVDLLHAGNLHGLGRWTSTRPRGKIETAIRDGRREAVRYNKIFGAYPTVVLVNESREEVVL